jgi:hypothetical protein
MNIFSQLGLTDIVSARDSRESSIVIPANAGYPSYSA